MVAILFSINVGNQISSASRNVIKSPDAFSIPVLRAIAGPEFFSNL